MSRDFTRSSRLEEQVQRILSDVLRGEARDPRLHNVIVTDAEVTRDLSLAKVYFAILGDEAEPDEVLAAFAKANGFLRSRLAKELTIRRVPELRYVHDNSGREGDRLEALIEHAVAQDKAGQDESGSDDSGEES